MVEVHFGSIHGSVYTADHGHCALPFVVLQTICRWDLQLRRTISWSIGFIWV